MTVLIFFNYSLNSSYFFKYSIDPSVQFQAAPVMSSKHKHYFLLSYTPLFAPLPPSVPSQHWWVTQEQGYSSYLMSGTRNLLMMKIPQCLQCHDTESSHRGRLSPVPKPHSMTFLHNNNHHNRDSSSESFSMRLDSELFQLQWAAERTSVLHETLSLHCQVFE